MTEKSLQHVLAIDTSSSKIDLALKFGSDRTVKLNEQVGTSHGQMLMRKIQDLLNSAGAKPDQLDGLVVCTGPGSFTGLRIALAAAKGMGEALSIPLAGVSLFEVAAVKLRAVTREVCIVVPFKKDECFVGMFKSGKVEVGKIESVAVSRLEGFIAGRKVTTIGMDLPDEAGPYSNGSVPRRIEYDAADLLEIGLARLEAGNPDDTGSLEPLYVQKSTAEIRYEQRRKD